MSCHPMILPPNRASISSADLTLLRGHSLLEEEQCSDLFQLFKRMLDQFDRLRKKNAFMEQYKKEKMFENGLEEFDDARLVAH